MVQSRTQSGVNWSASLAKAIPLGFMVAILFLVASQVWNAHPPEDGLRLRNGALLGGDFVAFYTGGLLLRTEPEGLYDFGVQREVRERILKETPDLVVGELPFVYPPLVAALMAPFSHLSLAAAYYLWVGLAMAVAGMALLGLALALGSLTPTRAVVGSLALAAFVPFSIDTLVGGQFAWLGIAVFASVSVAVLKGRPGLAGLLMALGYYKPPLFVFAALYLAIRLPPRFLVGCAVGAAVATGLTLGVYGIEGSVRYLAVAAGYRYGQELMEGVTLPPEAGVGFFGLLTSVLGDQGMNLWMLVVLMLALLAPAVVRQIRGAPLTRAELAYVVTASVAVSLQAIAYDLALLLVVFGLFAVEDRDRGVASESTSTSSSSHVHEPALTRNLALALGIAWFYLEFTARHMAVGEMTVNAASVAFVWMLVALLVQMRREDGGREGRALGSAQTGGRSVAPRETPGPD